MGTHADRMNALDVWFLNIEDPSDMLHIGSVGVFEGPPPRYPELLDLVERRLPQVPRYRQRVQRVPFDLARPVWVDDPEFSLRYHVRHTALPAPGGPVQLQALVTRIMAQPLDHRRPLWETWLVEGLEDGRWAMITKVHHCLVDGVAGTGLLGTVLSASPDEEPGAWRAWRPQEEPARAGLLREAVTDRLTEVGEVLRGAGAMLRQPRRSVGTATARARGAVELLRIADLTPATSLNGPIGPHRNWTWATASHHDVRRIRAALGGTHNDVVLAAVTRGFRDLLRERHELAGVDVIRTLVPVSIRGDHEHGRLDNRVAAMFADLPVAEGDAVERLRLVHQEMRRRKEAGGTDAVALLVDGTGLTPPWTLRLAMGAITRVFQRTGQRMVNTVTTNVPGPPIPLYLLGRRMQEIYPYVPIAEAIRIGVAIYTYDGAITFGLTGDQATTEDLEVLASGIEDGMLELVRAAEHRQATVEVS
jgi:diacylglycerol O-acyltransferase / wax synthase